MRFQHLNILFMKDKSNLYQLDGKVPIAQAVPVGLQHLLAMFVSNITPIIILANVVGIDSGLSAALIHNCMIIAGIGTMIQLFPIWRIGSRLPIVMGISFTFLSLAIFIGTSQGMGVLIGAVIVGGIVEGVYLHLETTNLQGIDGKKIRRRNTNHFRQPHNLRNL